MKKILCVLLASMLLCGCSGDDSITLACMQGLDCSELTSAIQDYYGADKVNVTVVDRDAIASGDYDVKIGAVAMGETLEYGMWKSKAIMHETACVVSRDEYRMSTDLDGVKLGIPDDFEYTRYISVPEGAEIERYKSRDTLISDLREGVIGAIVCSENIGGEVAAAVEGARVNILLDSEIYEYAVMSEDIDLINSLDAVIK